MKVISATIMKLSAMCFFAWLLVFSSMKFYAAPLPPSFEPLQKIYDWLHGGANSNFAPETESIVGSGLTVLPPRKTGPNVWGALAFVSLAVLIGIFIMPMHLPINKALDSLATEWRVIDNQRQEAAKKIGLGEDSALAQRHRAAQASLDRAERVVMDFYEDALKSLSPFRITWIAIALFAFLVLLAALIYLQSDRISSLQGERSAVQAHSNISSHLRGIEAHRPTVGYMWGVALIGLLAVFGNVSLSMWRIKSTARRATESHLTQFRSQFEKRLLAKMEHTEAMMFRSFSTLKALKEKIAEAHSQMEQKLEALTADIRTVTDQEVRRIQELANQKHRP